MNKNNTNKTEMFQRSKETRPGHARDTRRVSPRATCGYVSRAFGYVSRTSLDIYLARRRDSQRVGDRGRLRQYRPFEIPKMKPRSRRVARSPLGVGKRDHRSCLKQETCGNGDLGTVKTVGGGSRERGEFLKEREDRRRARTPRACSLRRGRASRASPRATTVTCPARPRTCAKGSSQKELGSSKSE